ncbi:MAG: peptidylprolyl isomerase [Oligoflexia bacterium]|nr:peptidylprolyl isomerase [Oligoflexia bacterium]
MRLIQMVPLCALLALNTAAWAEDQNDAVLATFADDQKITLQRLAQQQPALISWLGIGTGTEEVRGAIEDSIFQNVVAREAQDSELMKDPDVQEQVNKVLMTAYMKKHVKQDMIQVPESEVVKYYNDNKESKYKVQEEIKVSQILLPTLDQAQKVADELSKGASWDAVAAKASADSFGAKRHGTIGRIPPNQLLPELRSQVYSLKPGEISKPVKTAFGYHLLRLEEKPTVSYRPLEELKKDIYGILFRQKKNELVKDLKQDLWKKYDVKFNQAAIDQLVQNGAAQNASADRSSLDRAKRQPGQATELQVISETLDMGKIPAKKFSESILMANSTDKEIEIKRVGSTCKCIDVSVDTMKVAPGKSAKLTFTYDPAMFKEQGPVEKMLFIESSDQVEPRKFVRLFGDIAKG